MFLKTTKYLCKEMLKYSWTIFHEYSHTFTSQYPVCNKIKKLLFSFFNKNSSAL